MKQMSIDVQGDVDACMTHLCLNVLDILPSLNPHARVAMPETMKRLLPKPGLPQSRSENSLNLAFVSSR
jgi:hypothetical protein